jgi:hypothetical protein
MAPPLTRENLRRTNGWAHEPLPDQAVEDFQMVSLADFL